MRSARFPFSFGQRVRHADFPCTFIVLAQECDGDGWTISVSDLSGGGFWRFPQHELSFADIDEEQQAIAEWVGCTVEQLNRDHDGLHRRLSRWTGVESQSLRVSQGETLSEEEASLAALEEDAVLALQRFLCAALPPMRFAA